MGRSDTDGVDITAYYEDVIRLALEKTRASHGDFVIQQRPFEASIDRVKAILQSSSGIDVIWASVTPERMETMRYVQVDLLHELNNYRALLIRKNDLERFKGVNTLADLHALKTGNGSSWTDTKVMQANGFAVITAVDFGLLVKMLSAKRFDFITRGMHEIGMDLAMFPNANLAVVPNLVLKYSVPVRYGLFVRKTDEILAQRLEQGLAQASADGSLQKLFEHMSLFQVGRKIMENKPRIIELDNSAVFH
ncbi:MAG: hypothetical protein B0W54_02320 [Cellvibrio sp. 79]|nr:MAG: hypothetical protein B0W54_02320 [Cellvibrio sp. 79]